MIQDEDIDSSGSNILEKQAGTFSTPLTSVAGSEAGSDPVLLFYEFPC